MNFPGLRLIDLRQNSLNLKPVLIVMKGIASFPISRTRDYPGIFMLKLKICILACLKCFQTSHFPSQIPLSVIATCSPFASSHRHIWKALSQLCLIVFRGTILSVSAVTAKVHRGWNHKHVSCGLWNILLLKIICNVAPLLLATYEKPENRKVFNLCFSSIFKNLS